MVDSQVGQLDTLNQTDPNGILTGRLDMQHIGTFGVSGAASSLVKPAGWCHVINAYSLAFFDRHLKGQPAALLDGPSEQFPEVLFETRRTGGDHIREAGSSLADTKWRG